MKSGGPTFRSTQKVMKMAPAIVAAVTKAHAARSENGDRLVAAAWTDIT